MYFETPWIDRLWLEHIAQVTWPVLFTGTHSFASTSCSCEQQMGWLLSWTSYLGDLRGLRGLWFRALLHPSCYLWSHLAPLRRSCSCSWLSYLPATSKQWSRWTVPVLTFYQRWISKRKSELQLLSEEPVKQCLCRVRLFLRHCKDV